MQLDFDLYRLYTLHLCQHIIEILKYDHVQRAVTCHWIPKMQSRAANSVCEGGGDGRPPVPHLGSTGGVGQGAVEVVVGEGRGRYVLVGPGPGDHADYVRQLAPATILKLQFRIENQE